MSYDAIQISREINATALGEAYYGNSLHVARDIPCVTHNDVQCLNRWLNGTNTVSDGWRLQEISSYITEWAIKQAGANHAKI